MAEEICYLTELRSGKVKLEGGGVSFTGDVLKLNTVLQGSRLAEGVRIRLGPAKEVVTFQGLHEHLRRLPWAAYVPAKRGLPPIRVVAHKSRLYHSDAVKERAEVFLRQHLQLNDGAVTNEELPMIFMRFHHDRLQVSVDAGGPDLYKRGYRLAIGRAPLRETIAAALLRIASYNSGDFLWDPFCGSGTIPLEAASMVSGCPLRPTTDYAFQIWPSLKGPEQIGAAPLADPALAPAFSPSLSDSPTIVGSDRSGQALEAAKKNDDTLRQVTAAPVITWRQGDFEEIEGAIPVGASIVCNPPYGVRMGKPRDLTDLYGRFGALLKRRSDLKAVVLTAYEGFEAATAISWKEQARINNRGVVARIWQRS